MATSTATRNGKPTSTNRVIRSHGSHTKTSMTPVPASGSGGSPTNPPGIPLIVRIVCGLWMLVKVRLPKEIKPEDKAEVKMAIDRLAVGGWCCEQAKRTPQHDDLLTAGAEDEFESAKQIVQKLNAAKMSGTNGKSVAQKTSPDTDGPGSDNFYG